MSYQTLVDGCRFLPGSQLSGDLACLIPHYAPAFQEGATCCTGGKSEHSMSGDICRRMLMTPYKSGEKVDTTKGFERGKMRGQALSVNSSSTLRIQN